MKKLTSSRTFRVGVASGMLTLVVCAAQAQTSGVFVYPAKGQSPDQQGKDEYECSKWAKSQSGVDPNAAPAQPAGGQRAGKTLGGAAKGAALGAAIGAIAGDAGKGAAIGAVGGGVHGHKGARTDEKQAAATTQNAYQRAFAACLEGRGYTIK